MSQPNPEVLILVVTLVALCLAPVASRLVGRIGEQISSELDGGRTGDQLNSHLNSSYEGSMADDEIAQMIEARDFLRGEKTTDIDAEVRQLQDDDLREEIRQIVIASNERRARAGKPPLDVEAEVVRRLAEALGTNGHAR